MPTKWKMENGKLPKIDLTECIERRYIVLDILYYYNTTYTEWNF
jgi:hypothetical protein